MGIVQVLRDAGHQVTEHNTYAFPRGTRLPAACLVDLDHVAGDTQTILSHLRHVLEDSYLVVVGTAARIAGAADSFVDAELETSRVDATTLRAAVAGKPPRPSSELARAHRLWAEITPRQRAVLRWLAVGLDNPTIADYLGVGDRAIKAHISALLVLFDVDNRTKLAVLANQAGLRPDRNVR